MTTTATDTQMGQIKTLVKALKRRKHYDYRDLERALKAAGVPYSFEAIRGWVERDTKCKEPDRVLAVLSRLYSDDR